MLKKCTWCFVYIDTAQTGHRLNPNNDRDIYFTYCLEFSWSLGPPKGSILGLFGALLHFFPKILLLFNLLFRKPNPWDEATAPLVAVTGCWPHHRVGIGTLQVPQVRLQMYRQSGRDRPTDCRVLKGAGSRS